MHDPANDPILTAAIRLFGRRGVAAPTTEEVAAAAEIDVAALTAAWPTREALRGAALEALLLRWQGALPSSSDATTGDATTFEEMLVEALSYFSGEPDAARLLMREMMERPAEMRAGIEAHIAPWMAELAAAIRRGQANERLRPDLDPEAWSVEIVLLVLASFAAGPAVDGLLDDDPDRRPFALVQIIRSSLYKS